MPELSLFTGELGGVVAFGFMSGVAAGWSIAQRTVMKVANERIAELKTQVSKQNDRIQALEDLRFDLARGK